MDLDETLAEIAPGLLRYCRGRSAGSPLAEEAAQDALTALVQRWRQHGPPTSPRGFVFTIARRRLRRAQLRQSLFEPLDPRLAAGAVNGAGPGPLDPERETLDRHRWNRCREAIAALPARLRDALLLVAAADLDTATASEVLGISRSALKMRVLRARRQLRAQLEESP